MWKLEVTPEQLAIAESNGISRNLVYQRVRFKKMAVEDAITTPKKEYKKNQIENLSERIYSCRIPLSIEEKFLKAIESEKVTISDFLAKCVMEKLKS